MVGAAFGLRGNTPAFVAFALLSACASSDSGPGPGGGMDGGRDAAAVDAASDATSGDAGTDAGTDAGPMVDARMCEACEVHEDCATGSFCVTLSVGGKACVPSCVPDIPTCPRAFSCVLDVASGVDTTVCLPVGGTCCVDEDADGYGQGVGCMGDDCDDTDDATNPGADEICDGEDQDCDGAADDPPTDCMSGRCTSDGDGTYTAVTGASCAAATCESGTVDDCDLFTCEDGGEAGTRCATTCAPMGTDDDLFCIDEGHCDSGTCAMDVPDGMACDEDTDCVAGHCDNGFCCSTGTCCGVTSDCPGGGGVANVCDNSMTCQGTRGETMCNSSFQCQTMSGIPDDSACDTTTRALDCGLYDPVFCTGEVDQPPPACPTSCLADADCIDAAHCEIGFCVPDRPPGGSCMRGQDCMAGLFCVDGVCCTSSCTSTCQACNVTGALGTCTNIAAGADPAGECPGLSCMGYYSGFTSGGDVCYSRQNVPDATATCNGGGMCTDAATLCSTQPPGSVQIDCNDLCQIPVAGTCVGTTPGACTNLDDPAITTSCGAGACSRTVQRCTGGAPTTCTPGSPVAESCNGVDDDCDGTPDDGPSSVLCPPPMVGVSTSCIGGACRLDSCPGGSYDVDGDYTNGCECIDDGAANSCPGATPIGTLSGVGSSLMYAGRIPIGTQSDWLSVSVPSTGRGPSAGAPMISISHMGGGANPFRFDVQVSCAASATCGSGSPGGVVTYSFRDDQSFGTRAYTGPHTVAWPSSLVIRVSRIAAPTTCTEASYTLTISR